MTTYFRKDEKTAVLESSDGTHHRATIKDDFGNIKEVVRYVNQDKNQVISKMTQSGFNKAPGLF